MNLIVLGSLASVYVDTNTARRLVGLYGITRDLESVAQVADRLTAWLEADGGVDKIIFESLTWHIVVRYARCFQKDGGRNAQLHDAQVDALDDDELMTLHTGLLSRRHKTFAHAGEHCSDRLVVHLMADHPVDPVLTAMPSIEGPGAIVDPEQSALVARLCRLLLPIVRNHIEKCAQKLAVEFREPHSKIVADLRANLGRHAVPEQQAYAIMCQIGL